jgi:hypothetical protein
MEYLNRFLNNARQWANGRSWLLRAPVLVYLAYAGFRSFGNIEYRSIFSGITLAFHEMGHILFGPLGVFPMVLGGSLTQLLIPIVAALLLLRQSDYFGFAVGGGWLGLSAMDLAWYVGDARANALPLVSLGPEAEHDWFYLLGRLGWLRYDLQIAGLVRGLGALALILSLALGIWLCLVMAGSSDSQGGHEPGDEEGAMFQEWLGKQEG